MAVRRHVEKIRLGGDDEKAILVVLLLKFSVQSVPGTKSYRFTSDHNQKAGTKEVVGGRSAKNHGRRQSSIS